MNSTRDKRLFLAPQMLFRQCTELEACRAGPNIRGKEGKAGNWKLLAKQKRKKFRKTGGKKKVKFVD